ncbi:hypothetical protein PR048_005941 [Dryococelus australis]|uniref:Uncharacterized protein n=1 Tax=Dryococelus australis TaxID=614101 RepID=A0ABQ9IAS4_9NEOP|nr:hypothetical protein PR048_005941 [Dryococelus australis]
MLDMSLKKIMELDFGALVNKIVRIKPLCPIRWVYRRSQIDRILQNYGLLLDTLEQLKVEKNSHVHGLLEKLESSTTVLGFLMAQHIIVKLDILNNALQDSYWHGGSSFLNQNPITTLRSEEGFQHIVVETYSITKEHDLKYLQVPRQRKPSKRFSGPAEVFQTKTAEVLSKLP